MKKQSLLKETLKNGKRMAITGISSWPIGHSHIVLTGNQFPNRFFFSDSLLLFFLRKFNDLTPLTEHYAVTYNDLSPFSKELFVKLKRINPKYAHSWKSSRKLISSLHPRENYWSHFKYSQICHRIGVKMSQPKMIVRFRQESLIAPYLLRCIELRKQATTPFMKRLAKQMMNCK